MILIETNSHMPFKVGSTLYFCQSDGLRTFYVKQSKMAQKLGVPVQAVNYQPWSMCVKNGDTISPIDVEGLFPGTPSTVFCNPILVDDTLSFVHGGSLFTVDVNAEVKTPSLIATGVSCGFWSVAGITVARKQSVGSSIFFPDGESRHFPDENIVRVAPNGDDLIYTSKSGTLRKSFILHTDGSISRITVDGADVYKCCLDGDYVIHAVCGETFEDRKLHRDLYTLVSHA